MAKLLAQRAGAALQLLIVDEGFGTQDAEGCDSFAAALRADRLIAAINAIASDFACILTVTHMPHLKEAFQARIEVNKTQSGSQVRLLIKSTPVFFQLFTKAVEYVVLSSSL